MDIDSINAGTPASKGWLRPVCGELQAKNIYADNLYLSGGGSGIPGPPGPAGEQGPQGPPGQSASISVESVTTGAPGSAVIFQNVGAGPSAAFVVSIPRGDPGVGEQGPPGNPGAQGPAGIMTVGTVTTDAPGSAVSFVNVGSPENATFDISIPRGDVGPKGDQGDPGPAGAPGGSASILTYHAKINGSNVPSSTIGDLVWNTTGQTDATLVYLSHRQVGGQDVERILEIATTGSTLLIQADDNSGQYQTFTMTEPPVATPGEYVTFLVTLDDTGGALFANNDDLLVSIVVKGTPGPEGPPGEAGPPGATGAQGDPGPPGDAATITIGSTTTGAPGTSASVVAVGTTAAQIFDFTIPTGAAGPPGAPGAQGDPGPAGTAATLTVGTTTTGAAGSSALVTQSGTSSARVFDFTIPQGTQGPQGPQGIQGNAGPAGTTPVFSIGTVNAADYPTCSATVDVTDPAAPVLSFVVPRGPAGISSGVTIANTGSTSAQRVLFTATASGGTATTLNTHATGLSYVPATQVLTSTGNITAASFSGPLSGNATSATQVTTTNSSSTALHYLALSDVNGGATSNLRTATVLTYTPGEAGGATLRLPRIIASGTITAPSFVGVATDAQQVMTVTTASTATRYLCLTPDSNSVATAADIQTAPALTYVPSTNALSVGSVTATTFTGALTGNATTATRVTTTATAVNVSRFITFAPANNSVGAASDIQTAAALTYVPQTGLLSVGSVTATTFTGSLTGNASSATQVATVRNGANLTRYLLFSPVDNSVAANTDLYTATALTYNPSTAAMSVQNLTVTGTLSATVSSANNLSGTTAGSFPYQSASGTTSYYANGTAGQILRSSGAALAPTWVSPSSLIRGYTVPFSSGGTVAGYQYANVGAAGRTDVTTSGVVTRFVVPVAGTIEAATVAFSTAAAASTFSIFKNAASAYTSGALFTAAGGNVLVNSGLLVNVVAGDVIEVRTNTLNFGVMCVVIYFT